MSIYDELAAFSPNDPILLCEEHYKLLVNESMWRVAEEREDKEQREGETGKEQEE